MHVQLLIRYNTISLGVGGTSSIRLLPRKTWRLQRLKWAFTLIVSLFANTKLKAATNCHLGRNYSFAVRFDLANSCNTRRANCKVMLNEIANHTAVVNNFQNANICRIGSKRPRNCRKLYRKLTGS